MKIPVDIHIKSERCFPNNTSKNAPEHVDKEEFTISGTMKNTKNGFQIEYTEEDGGLITLVDTFGDSAMINRMGAYNTHMVFSREKVHFCNCDTGFISMQMRVRTKHLYNTLSMDGGKLDIDFNVEIAGNLAEKNRLILSVSPDKSIIKS